jgi:hypothetical protein
MTRAFSDPHRLANSAATSTLLHALGLASLYMAHGALGTARVTVNPPNVAVVELTPEVDSNVSVVPPTPIQPVESAPSEAAGKPEQGRESEREEPGPGESLQTDEHASGAPKDGAQSPKSMPDTGQESVPDADKKALHENWIKNLTEAMSRGTTGSNQIFSVDLRAMSHAGRFKQRVAKIIDAAPDLLVFLEGSSFVPSRDFSRLATVYRGNLSAPALLVVSLVPKRFTDQTFLERVNEKGPRGRWLPFKRDRSRTFQSVNWHHGSYRDLCLLRQTGSDTFLITSVAGLNRIATTLRGDFRRYLEHALEIAPSEPGSGGKPVAQLRGFRALVAAPPDSGADAEFITLSTLGDSGALIHASWHLRNTAPDAVGKVDARSKILLWRFGLRDVAERALVEIESSELMTIQTRVTADEMRLFLSQLQAQGGKKKMEAMQPDTRPPEHCPNALAAALGPEEPTTVEVHEPLLVQRVSDGEVHATVGPGPLTVSSLVRAPRFVPEQRDGVLLGIRLFGSRPGSDTSQLGFQNGDRLESINSQPITSPDQVLPYTARYEVAVVRRGLPRVWTIVQVEHPDAGADATAP